jgi:hypothetical protein
LKTNLTLLDGNSELLIVSVQEKAWKIVHDFIKPLLSDEEIKAEFFDEIDGYRVFQH